jgi:3' terminal RNA ribose 2'-O-methyltransferase Hen1
VDEAIRRLTADAAPDDDTADLERDAEEADLERPLSLHERRLGTVVATLKEHECRRVIDLGCGEGKLLRLLLQERQFETIVGMDVAWRSLEIAAERLHLDRMPSRQRERITLLHGSLLYRDARLAGYDGAAVVEVIEHLDAPRLAAFERALFEFARPRVAVITTPNAEYNALWPSLPAGRFRHRDHRFEWTRAQFATWAESVAERFGYQVRFRPIGDEDPTLGPPSQMGLFIR